VCPRAADGDGIVQREGTGETLGPRHSALCEPWDATAHSYYKLHGKPARGNMA
jgi:hypothetical protein